MSDDFDDDVPEKPAVEGVRILGAREASAAVEPAPGSVIPEETLRPRLEPPPDVRPGARFPLPAERVTDADITGLSPARTPMPPPIPVSESSGALPLPHWTEAPTGEVPTIAPEDGVEDDIFSPSGGMRFRTDATGWSETDFGDFDDEPVHDDSGAFGAIVEIPEVDDNEVFAAEVAAKRGSATRPKAARPGAARPGAARPGAAATASAYGVSRSEGRAPLAPVRGDDLASRLITAAVLVVVGLSAFALGRVATAVLVSAIVMVGAFELYEGIRRAGFQPATVIGLLGSTALVGIAYNYGERALPLVSAVVLAFTLLWYLAKVVHARPMVNAAVTLLGFSYVGILGGFGGLLLVYPNGVGMVIGLVICAVGYDAVGYLVGSRIGRRPLAPDVSPNKTVEGLVAGMVASVVLGAVVAKVMGLTPWNSLGDGLLLGIVVAVFAPLGDLCESMLKRDLGLKDFGALLPGHGGVLDRFDAMLFCLPAVYYLVLARGLI